MFTLNKRAPVTHEALGARFTFAPIDLTMWRAARNAGARARGVEDDSDDDLVGSDIRVAVGLELLKRGLTGWAEVVDGETGKPLAFSTDARDELLADPLVVEALDGLYVVPFLNRLAEKNASSPSLNGTGAGAMQGKATARRAAKSATAARGAKSVPTKPKAH